MKVIPVIDILGGVVVRGVAGKRNEYRPVESRLVDSAEPLAVAAAFREKLGLIDVYLADLDAILHARPNVELYRALSDAGGKLMIDAGLRDAPSASSLVASDAAAIVCGLETFSEPNDLATLCREHGSERIIFSLDMKAGTPLGDLSIWGSNDPFAIAARAVQSGINRMIVLDLASVGGGTGISTLPLCRRLTAEYPHLRLITGGGIRNVDDLLSLNDAAIDGILVASALHSGVIGRAEIERLSTT